VARNSTLQSLGVSKVSFSVDWGFWYRVYYWSAFGILLIGSFWRLFPGFLWGIGREPPLLESES
jgi:hypothetical protein